MAPATQTTPETTDEIIEAAANASVNGWMTNASGRPEELASLTRRIAERREGLSVALPTQGDYSAFEDDLGRTPAHAELVEFDDLFFSELENRLEQRGFEVRFSGQRWAVYHNGVQVSRTA